MVAGQARRAAGWGGDGAAGARGRGPWAPCEGSSRGAAWPGSRATAVPQHSWAGAEGGSSSESSGRRRPSLRGASVAEAGGHETWSTSGCRLNIFLLLNVPFFPSSTQYKLLPKDEV